MRNSKQLFISIVIVIFATQGLTAIAGEAVRNVTATADSENPWDDKRLASNLVDGSGLDENGTVHNQNFMCMWLSAEKGKGFANPNPGTVVGPAWVRFEFDNLYKLDRMWVWNYNQIGNKKRGLKNVTIEYSTTGGTNSSDWAKLGEFQWDMGVPEKDTRGFQGADFGGVEVKYVVITAGKTDGNWGDINYGLSEIRFEGTTNFATQPSPAENQTNVSPQTQLKWLAGNNAKAHDIYIGTDKNAVTKASRSAHSNIIDFAQATAESQYKPSSAFEFDATYYWRVDEVDNSGKPAWKGRVWSFKTGVTKASNPRPADGRRGLGRFVRWDKGSLAAEADSQDVYFGTSRKEIESADTSSAVYMGRQSHAVYDTAGYGLELGKTYYWRIDQVDGQKKWKGDTWSFTCWRSLVYNCDGDSVFGSSGGDINIWIQNVFGPIEDSQCDSLWWNDGSGGNTAKYDSDVLEMWGQRLGEPDPAIARWIAEGNDPPKVIVREAHKRGIEAFFSFRINDIHDSLGSCTKEFPTFKEKNPDWMIGQGWANCVWTSLRFDVPEVREIKFNTVKEIFEKYDFDGIEIDFLRSAPYFLPGTEPQNAHILTGLLRRIRNHLNEKAIQRGREITLAVRVNENLDACALDGFEVEKWIAEDMVDIIVLGSGTIDLDIEDFKALTEGTDILIYACLYGWPSKYMPISTEMVRALATNYFYQGADGIYTFNWYPHSSLYQDPLHDEMGDPQTLIGKDKTFAADRGEPSTAYPHNWMNLPLPAELKAGQTLEAPILVGEDFSKGLQPKRIDLAIHLDKFEATDSLLVLLNRKPLPQGIKSNNDIIIPLKGEQLTQGRNQILISAIKGQFKLTGMEINVTY